MMIDELFFMLELEFSSRAYAGVNQCVSPCKIKMGFLWLASTGGNNPLYLESRFGVCCTGLSSHVFSK